MRAREHNLGKIVMGRPASRDAGGGNDAFADRLASAPDLDRGDRRHGRAANTRALAQRLITDAQREMAWANSGLCLVAVALCAITTLIAMQWQCATEHTANLVMPLSICVVVIALLYGRWPSVVATVINVAVSISFIAGTLAVPDVQYLLTFAVIATVGLVVVILLPGCAIRRASPVPSGTTYPPFI